ncbi:TIGR03086 family metal-binding protein [Actinomadura sp. ATCC 31491]|uniref:TIGR03086 family metal-binding protein n=1 Tax=Actinomadura luzonensis TaxID=2805427 RepID=A0ABT0GCI5_9ACTN|nr:TIGR03086 family metal-binding protein [Actinomadura luzonensis]MCK2221821.1 TIGR03086 family metal-binding protein [Actinomadura luzonensis]
MNGERERALTAGVALLERAIDYTLGSLRVVSPDMLCRPTPCAGWTLQRLLTHVTGSLRALNEAATGDVALVPEPVGARRAARGGDLALLVRDDATEVLGTWANVISGGPVSIGDRHLTSPMVAAVGAIEIAVHGWDIARACGEHRPIPPLTAAELLDLARLFVTPADRPHRFGAPRRVVPGASPGARLLAYLGRDPAWPGTPPCSS